MTHIDPVKTLDSAAIAPAIESAGRQIPPLWPLVSSVAVNPFLGQMSETLADVSARLGRVGGIAVTMPRDWYLDRIADGEITDADLANALAASAQTETPQNVEALKAAASVPQSEKVPLPTVADLAGHAEGVDWSSVIAERFGVWAGGYFDQGQALWAAPQGPRAWTAWTSYAIHDLTAEIAGLKDFAAFFATAPADPTEAVARAVRTLGLEAEALETYFHQLLLSLGGWAQYARYELWRAELAGETDTTISDFLAIRLLWEEALYLQHESQIGDAWAQAKAAHALPVTPSESDIVDAILQDAAERAAQRELATGLTGPVPDNPDQRPALQAAFCIDVRSEVFRRALEAVDPSIRTLGFAGFFGVAAKHRGFASDVEELRLPVLLNPGVTSCSTGSDDDAAEKSARYRARAKRAWGRFKLAAVSSFAFVEAMGPVYIGKLVRDAFGIAAKPAKAGPVPRLDPDLGLTDKIDAAEKVLRAMSLTSDFARIVLLAGHGATVVNNPLASGLQCGACGGYSGEVNARLLASLLNDEDVQHGLKDRGITVPDDTLFVAALHDTTTDDVTLYDQDTNASGHAADLATVRAWLTAAGKVTRGERALRLPGAANENDIALRARDWSEVRPEWALAGCKAFIAAPRSRTAGRSLEGRAFLHDYDWKQDSENGFGVLELIMTAPVVVASWISLQYYGSTVAPETFGSGNKLLHNVVGGFGVFEGNGGVLRGGLPRQSVHDGDSYVHEPLRLSVMIEAPSEAMTNILKRHDDVRALFDNVWLHLFAIGEDGRVTQRYAGDLQWESFDAGSAMDLDSAAA